MKLNLKDIMSLKKRLSISLFFWIQSYCNIKSTYLTYDNLFSFTFISFLSFSLVLFLFHYALSLPFSFLMLGSWLSSIYNTQCTFHVTFIKKFWCIIKKRIRKNRKSVSSRIVILCNTKGTNGRGDGGGMSRRRGRRGERERKREWERGREKKERE